MSFRKLIHGVSFWSTRSRKKSDASHVSDACQWSPREGRSAVPRQLSDAWLPRQGSYPQFRMTHCQDMVLKQGFLYKKRERSSVASFRGPWQSGYFVLKKSPGYAGLLLDEYRDASLRVTKETLFLDTVKHVGPVTTARSKQYAFQVVVLGRSPLFFACDNEFLRSEWIDVFSRYTEEPLDQAVTHGRRSPEGGPSARQLRQSQSASVYVDMKGEEANQRPSVSESKGYEVIIQKTPLSEGNDLHGSYVLQISKTRLSFKHVDKKEYILSWPLTQLRGFKSQSEQQLIILETGRRCHFGKGRLIMKTRFVEAIVNDIREAIASDNLSSDNSSDSESENNHRPVSRTVSDQQCNVTVSGRPRRVHSDKVIHQASDGRTPNSKIAKKPVPISPTLLNSALMPPSNSDVKSPLLVAEHSGEDVFRFDNNLGVFTEVKMKKETLQKASDWKTSTTFSKTMTEWRSETEQSSNDYDEGSEEHPYIDIIADENAEKPLGSDEASSLLAQVVADLTEPQKRNCFVKSNSTGGIQMKPLETHEERRASAPVVGSTEFMASSSASEADAQGGMSNTQRKLKLEKITEVSFVETTDSGDVAPPPKGHSTMNKSLSLTNDRPRSMSELVDIDLETPTQVVKNMRRSRTFLGIMKSSVGSSLTDLSSEKHRELRASYSFSPSSDFSNQLAKGSCHFGLAASFEKVPSFPKSRVVRAVENIGGLENSRLLFNMSPLPPEFCERKSTDRDKDQTSPVSPTFNGTIPPRPPKDNSIKTRKSRSTSRSPPPLPERLPSSPVIPAKERTHSIKHDSWSKPYTNSPPKVQPRIPNALPLQSTTGLTNSAESVSPPPRPPKPESLSSSIRKTAFDQNRQPSASFSPLCSARHHVAEKRVDGYQWDVDHDRDRNQQVGKVKHPMVTVTPPRSPNFDAKAKVIMRGLSQSDTDIMESLEQPMKAALESSRSVSRS